MSGKTISPGETVLDATAQRAAVKVIPVSAIVPTANRPLPLARTLESLGLQGILPAELIVIDSSGSGMSKKVVDGYRTKWGQYCNVKWFGARQPGAAVQRNQGVISATQPFIWFFDDDILFEAGCGERLWSALEKDAGLGGVNAMIVNQRYQPPGPVSRTLFALLQGRREKSFAGKVIGPALNLLPEDREDLPEVAPVEWMNTTCTIYRREALPSPVFDSVFTGYSLMEDLTLSLRVGKKWRLANARTARIFHDSQPGAHKADVRVLAEMELVNRHYVMTKIMERRGIVDYLRLFMWEAFQLSVTVARGKSRANFIRILRGKWQAVRQIRRHAR